MAIRCRQDIIIDNRIEVLVLVVIPFCYPHFHLHSEHIDSVRDEPMPFDVTIFRP